MAQAIRTIGNVLNEASDAYERGMESRRREALTNVQLQGQIEDRNYQRSERERLTRIRDRIAQAGRETFEVEETVPGAITQDADGAAIRSPDAKRTRVINPFDGSPEAVAATATWLGKVGKIRMEEGEFTPEQLQAFQQSMDYSETRGIRQAVRRYFTTNDQKELAPIEKMFGMQEGSFRLMTEDQNGIPSIVAEGVQIINGKPQKVTRDMEMWFTMNGITEPSAVIKAKDERLNSASNRDYQRNIGDAARRRSESSVLAAEAKVANAGQHNVFAQTIADNKDRRDFPVALTDRFSGEVKLEKDTDFDGFVRRIGGNAIDIEGLNGAQAYNFAVAQMSQINSRAVQMLERDLASKQKAIDDARAAGNSEAELAAKKALRELQSPTGTLSSFRRYRQDLVDRLLERANQPTQPQE